MSEPRDPNVTADLSAVRADSPPPDEPLGSIDFVRGLDSTQPTATFEHHARAVTPGPECTTDHTPASPVVTGQRGPYVPEPDAEQLGAVMKNGLGRVSVPGYAIEGVLGRGAMGVVYKARHLKLKRAVALKMVLAGGHAGPRELARFRIEAEAVARLQHPNIVQIHEVGESGGHPYCALEFVEGGNLAGKLDGKPLPAHEAARLVELLARAMQMAHSRNVIHRDLKPANILLTTDGTPKITDFGLARQMDSDSSETQAGAVMGTPSYMAPEQASGQAHEAGPPADIYALGAILYECLVGRPPFKSKSVVETLVQVRTQEPTPPSRLQRAVPLDLDTICLKCLRKEPEKRFASAAELADELVRYQQGEPILARRVGRRERAVKWARRNPVVASAVATVVLALLAAVVVSSYFAVQANSQSVLAVYNAGVANERAREAKAIARRATERAYLSDMRLLQRYWDANLLGPFPGLLAQQRPEHTGGLDLRGFEWHYWDRQTRTIATLDGHRDVIWSVAYSADGKFIVSGSDDKSVRVWDAATWQEKFTLMGHTSGVLCVAISPDSKRIVSSAGDNLVKVWDAETGREQLTLKGHTKHVPGVAISPDGKRIASAGADKTVKVWNAETGQEMLSLTGHQADVRSVAFRPDGQRIVSGCGDKTAKVWDAETGQERLTFTGQTDSVRCVAFSPDGKRIVSGSQDLTIKVWDAETGREFLTLRGHADWVRGVAFSPDGKRIVSGSSDQTVKVWDADSGKELFSLRGHADWVRGVASSPDGKRIVSGSSDRTVKIWEAERSQSVPVLTGHRSQVTAVALSPDGKSIVSAGGEWDGKQSRYVAGELKLWDTGGRARDLLQQESGVACVAFRPDGVLLASGSGIWDAKANRYASGEVRLWSADGEAVATLTGHASSVLAVAFSPDGGLLASSAMDGSIQLWDVAKRQKALELPGHAQAMTALAFSPDGKLLAVAGFDQSITFYDVAKRAVTRSMATNLGIASLAFSPDCMRVAVAGYGPQGVVLIYEVATGTHVQTLTGHTRNSTGIIFSHDGKRIATCSEDGTVRLWDAASGQEVLALQGHGNVVRGVAFSKDGCRLVSGGWDRTVRVWDASPLP